MQHNQNESKLVKVSNFSIESLPIHDMVSRGAVVVLNKKIFYFKNGMISAYDVISGQLQKKLEIEARHPATITRIRDHILLKEHSHLVTNAAYILTEDLKIEITRDAYFDKIDISSQYIAYGHKNIYIYKRNEKESKPSSINYETNINFCDFIFTSNHDLLVLSKNEVTNNFYLTRWQNRQNKWVQLHSTFIELHSSKRCDYKLIALNDAQVVVVSTDNETYFNLVDVNEFRVGKTWRLNFGIAYDKIILLNAHTIISVDEWTFRKNIIIDFHNQKYQILKGRIDNDFYKIFDFYYESNQLTTLFTYNQNCVVQRCALQPNLNNSVIKAIHPIIDLPKAIKKIINDYFNGDFLLLVKVDQFCQWKNLFSNLQIHSLKFLDFEDIARCQSVSKHTAETAKHSSIWRLHFNRHFVPLLTSLEEKAENFYQKFKVSYLQFIKDIPEFENRYLLRRFKEDKFHGLLPYRASQYLGAPDHLGYPFAYWALKNKHQSLLNWIYEGEGVRQNIASAIYCNQKQAILNFIKKSKFDSDSNATTVLQDAVLMGQLDIVQALMLVEKDIPESKNKTPPIAYAALLGHYDIVVFLISEISAGKLKNYKNHFEWALICAALRNHLRVVELLLKLNVNIFFLNNKNQNAFDLTTDIKIKKLLLCAELDVVIKAVADEKKSGSQSRFFKHSDMSLAAEFKGALQTGKEQEFLAKYQPRNLPNQLRNIYYKAASFAKNDQSMNRRFVI